MKNFKLFPFALGMIAGVGGAAVIFAYTVTSSLNLAKVGANVTLKLPRQLVQSMSENRGSPVQISENVSFVCPTDQEDCLLSLNSKQ